MRYGINHKNSKHGFSSRKGIHPIYCRWRDMQTRCKNPNYKQFSDYGGRGIKCSWSSFEEFKDDMLPSYEIHVKKYGLANTTLDRKDVNGPYSKDNCRWATRQLQGQNTRTNHLITYEGETLNMQQWANKLGINYQTLATRLNTYGWSVKDALTIPSLAPFQKRDKTFSTGSK